MRMIWWSPSITLLLLLLDFRYQYQYKYHRYQYTYHRLHAKVIPHAHTYGRNPSRPRKSLKSCLISLSCIVNWPQSICLKQEAGWKHKAIPMPLLLSQQQVTVPVLGSTRQIYTGFGKYPKSNMLDNFFPMDSEFSIPYLFVSRVLDDCGW